MLGYSFLDFFERRDKFIKMDERTWAVIDLDKLRRNVKALKKAIKQPSYQAIKILAVVKADAYGHGVMEISRVLKEEKIDMLGVASIDEALELKKIGLPIVILSPTGINNIRVIVKEAFSPTVTHYPFAVELNEEARRTGKRVKIHIEIDTGMERTGVPLNKGVKFVTSLLELENLVIESIFTHLAEPNNPDSDFTSVQIDRFKEVIRALERKKIHIPLVHTASTAAILNFPESYFNMVRPGILLYGLYTSPSCNKRVKVEPILSLYTRVCQLNLLPKGVGISYGRTYKTKKEQKIATLWVGYGDGYPRSLSNKGQVIIKGRLAPIVGNVCMDLTMIDVTHIPDVKVGNLVTLIGRDGEVELTADRIAELAGTINYEIATRICPRVPRVYVNNGKPSRVRSLLGDKKIN